LHGNALHMMNPFSEARWDESQERAMRVSGRSMWISAVTILLTALLQGNAGACSVPVFRYALEHWKPSSFTAHVFHRGKLTAGHQSLIEKLEKASARSNLKVTTIDLDQQPTTEQASLWKLRGKTTLPWVIVQYPEDDEEAVPAAVGNLDEAFLDSLLDS